MEDFKTYGLIGKSLSHSFSPLYFEEKLEREEIIDVQYLSFPLKSIEDFPTLLEEYNISGLNVTIPYKQEIIPYLDELRGAAAEIKAVNCIAFEDGKLIGYNTDVIGFERSISPLLNNGHSNAIVLGTGGAAQAIAFVLRKLKIEYTFVSRQNNKDFLNFEAAERLLSEFPLIINTTPIGTHPNEADCPLSTLDGIGPEHLVYDLIYNPETSKLLAQASDRGASIKNGLEMLQIQAEESWKIWNK
jgi:shikimate dehydrogenase